MVAILPFADDGLAGKIFLERKFPGNCVAILPFADDGLAGINGQAGKVFERVAILPFADDGLAGSLYAAWETV